MVSWLAITLVVLVIVVIYVFIEMRRARHKMFAYFLIGLILFFFVTGWYVFKDKEVNFDSFKGVMDAGKIYFSWIGGAFGNLKSITTNAIKMDWSNSTG